MLMVMFMIEILLKGLPTRILEKDDYESDDFARFSGQGWMWALTDSVNCRDASKKKYITLIHFVLQAQTP